MIAVEKIITAVQNKFEGGSSFTVDWFSVLAEGAQAMLQQIAPKTLNIEVPIFGGVIGGVSLYYCPADVGAPNGIYDNLNRLNYRYVAPNEFQNAIVYGNSAKVFTIISKNGGQFIVLSSLAGISTLVFNEMTTTAGFDADMTLTLNTRDFISNNASIMGTFTDTDTSIAANFDQPQNIAEYMFGTVIVPFKLLANNRNIASVNFKIKSDADNYWTISGTEMLTNAIIGWNIGRLPMEGRVPTGTPDEEDVNTWELVITMDTGETETILLGQISLQNTVPILFNYTSNTIFVDHTTFERIAAPVVAEDYLDVTLEEAQILIYECCRITVQMASTDKMNSQESSRFDTELARKYQLYYGKNPSNELPISYNLSPNISKQMPIENDIGWGEIPGFFIDPQVITPATVSYNETPIGSVNGTNTDFQLLHVPNPSGSLILTVNGQVMTVGEDFTLTGAAIAFVLAPTVGSIIRARYEY